MAEALGLAASVIAVLQLTASVINVCYVYQGGVRNAPRDLNRITDQLVGLRAVLENLLKLAQTEDSTGCPRLSTLKLLTAPDGPLPKCETELKHLKEKLEPASGWRKFGQAVTWPLKEGEVRVTLDHIERTKVILHLALTADQTTLTLAIQDGIAAVHADIMALQGDVTDLNQSVEFFKVGELRQEIRDWLKDPDPSKNHNDARSKRHSTTGTWFTGGEQFAKWKNDPCSFLWLHGTMGCGKTILCSTIIQDVSLQCQSTSSVAMAYFYFDFNNSKKQSANGFLSSLIMQFSAQVPGSLNALSRYYSEHLNGIRQPATDSLAEILKDIIAGLRHAYIIIDALDECTEREMLLDVIKQIVAWKFDNLHILATSRKENDIEECFNTRASCQLDIHSALVEADIRLHIHDMVQNDSKLRRFPALVQEEIEICLVAGAHGMFRWVACQLDTLRHCWTPNAARRALKVLPKDLGETYSRILENIKGEGRDYAFKILQWLTFSTCPVTLEEVAEVLAIDFDRRPQFQPGERLSNPLDILAICSSLVSVSTPMAKAANQENIAVTTHGTGVSWPVMTAEVQLAHFSVKEYLTSGHITHSQPPLNGFNELAANSFISRSCLAYLLQFNTHSSLDSGIIKQFPLAQYAARNWIFHARYEDVANSHCVQELITDLLQPDSAQYFNWVRLREMHKSSVSTDLSKSSTHIAYPLYYASLSGLDEIARWLIRSGADVNRRHTDSEFGTALCAASYAGHTTIVQLLLDSGADISAKGVDSGCALQLASSEGHDNVVRILLGYGADANASDDIEGSALNDACDFGHEAVVRLLLDNGADFNSTLTGHSPLQIASYNGHLEIVQLLLDRGAEINRQTELYSNTLQAALEGGHVAIAQLLIDRGADIKAKGGNLGNILQAASSSGNEAVVQLALSEGVDVNERGGFYDNALQAASYEGHDAIVRLLLFEGADVNLQGGAYTNALIAASCQGYTVIVSVLLDHGADVNAIGGDEGGALQAAASGGHELIVELLMQNGANINAVGGDLVGSALQAAAENGHKIVVQMLLQHGADVNVIGPSDSSALQDASSHGHLAIVQMLLDRGATINNALQEASHDGEEEAVRLLLDHGADVNAKGGTYSYALHAASSEGHDTIVKLLLSKGANPNLTDGHYGTAIHAALLDGHETVVELLLDNGADFNICVEKHGTALYMAASNGHKVIVQALLDRGAQINAKGGFCGSTLQVVSAQGYESLVQLLLDRGADVNAHGGHYTTALRAAAYKGHKVVVQQLLNKGADVNEASGGKYGNPLNAAISKGHKEIVELLLAHGAG